MNSNFKPSPRVRPVTRRLTPLAWVLIGVGALILLLACIGGGIAIANRPDDEPWQPTATATAVPTATEVLPTATPTEWYEPIMTATPLPPTPTPPPAVTWTVTPDTSGLMDPGYGTVPPEIDDWIWESFVAALGCYVIQDPNTPGPGWPAVELPQDNVALFEEAVRHLPEDFDVLYGACHLPNREDILNPGRAPLTAEFGVRMPAACDTPTHCYVGMTLQVTGIVVYDQDFCHEYNLGDSPCWGRVYRPLYEHVFVKAVMEYDEETGIWMMTEYTRTDL